MGYSKEIFIDETCKGFICEVCSDVLEDPVFTQDEAALVCAACVEQDKILSPNEEETNHRRAPPEFLIQHFALRVRCHLAKYGCPIVTTLANLDQHLSICEYAPECSDMDENLEYLEVDEEKAVIGNIVNAAREAVPDVIESDLSDHFNKIVIHCLSLALFADFDLGPIERTAEMSLSALCPDFAWKVTLTVERVESESDTGLGTLPSVSTQSTDEVLHVKFGKLHVFTSKSENVKFTRTIEDFTEPSSTEIEQIDIKEEDFEFEDTLSPGLIY